MNHPRLLMSTSQLGVFVVFLIEDPPPSCLGVPNTFPFMTTNRGAAGGPGVDEGAHHEARVQQDHET